MNRIQPVSPPSLMKPAGFSHGYEVKGIYVLDVPGYKARLKDLGPVYRETLVGAHDLFDASDGCLIEIEAVAGLG